MFEEIVQREMLPQAQAITAGWREHGSPPDIMHLYHFSLHSEKQPDVLRLTCRGILDEPRDAVPPTIAEIRQALGDIVLLRLADN